jgi:N-alpha-acetyl-L-2,4-diaminobutyrate deacetylase
MSAPCRVTTTVDFDAACRQFRVLSVPCSSNDSAWGAVRIPIVVLKGGAGPTLPGYCLAVIATEREPR